MDSTRYQINAIIRRHDHLTFACEAQPDNVVARNELLGRCAVRRNANYSGSQIGVKPDWGHKPDWGQACVIRVLPGDAL